MRRGVEIMWVVLAGCGQLAFDSVPPSSDSDASTPEDAEARSEAGSDAATERCGDGEISGAEQCDPPGASCSPDCLERWVCGDGTRAGEEACDDGNSTDGDGCETDCSFSCESNDDCSNGEECDGDELCDVDAHICRPGTFRDGMDCAGMDGEAGVCRVGLCAAAGCGNGTQEPGEDCDDGNAIAGDGCESDCSFSCEGDVDCDDGSACNGTEACDIGTHVCVIAALLPDGDGCDRDGDVDTRDICLGGDCLPSLCGDGFLDLGGAEECDDGNRANGDGCENTCKFSCTDDSCDDGKQCNGTEICSDDRTCMPGTPLMDGARCGVSSSCQSGICVSFDSGVGDAGFDVMLSGPDGAVGTPCGTAMCGRGEFCCNASCNECAMIGAACLDRICPPAS